MLDYGLLQQYFNALSQYIYRETNQPFTSFSHEFMVRHEAYKIRLREKALQILNTREWHKDIIGSGTLIDRLVAAIEQKENNFFVHQAGRFGEDGRAHQFLYRAKPNKLETYKTEEVIFDLYKGTVSDQDAFERLMELGGRKYALLAYLFFIKDERKYLPIATSNFDEIFERLNIDFKTSRKCSWENYVEFNRIIADVMNFLAVRLQNEVRLIDAHSFLWTMRWAVSDLPPEQELLYQATELCTRERVSTGSQPPFEQVSKDVSRPVDFVELQRQRIIIGKQAEALVLEHERQRLHAAGQPALADRVELVSDNYSLGYDILSYEEDGQERQIEVKTLAVQENQKSFHISSNELRKSSTLSNYYIFLVVRPDSQTPRIFYLHRPNLSDTRYYEVAPVEFIVTFS